MFCNHSPDRRQGGGRVSWVWCREEAGGRGGCGVWEAWEDGGPPLTRRELGLDAPPPQGPLAQHHVAAFPLDLEDAPKQDPLRHRLWELGRPKGRPLLQGAHPVPAFPQEHGGRRAGRNRRPSRGLLGRKSVCNLGLGRVRCCQGNRAASLNGGGAGRRGRPLEFPLV